MADPPTEPTVPGMRIGRLVVRRTLGSGSFATVVEAYDELLDDDVAVKLLADRWLDHGDVRARFLEEGRLMRRILSPGVASVYDIGETEDGRPYLVLDLADRGTLADLLRDPLPIDEVVRLGVEIATAVADLHRHGLLHRDLKPSNILITTAPDGGERVLVSDLGLAKSLDQASGFTLGAGTAGYAAPEQFAPGGDLDVRADVYSLGAVVRTMLHTTRGRRRGATRRTRERIERVVSRALSPDRAQRQADATAFAEELSRTVTGSPRVVLGRRLAAGAAAAVGVTVGALAGPELAPSGSARFESKEAGLSFRVPSDLADGAVARVSWSLPGQTNPPSGVLVTEDLTRWSEPTSGVRGVLATIGVDADTRESRIVLGHPGCTAARPRSVTADGHEGEVLVWSGCPGGAVFHEGLVTVGGGEAVLYVQAANLTDDEVDAFLGSLDIG